MINKPRKLRRGEQPNGELINRLIEASYIANYITVDPPLCVAMDAGGIHFWIDWAGIGEQTIGSGGASGGPGPGGPGAGGPNLTFNTNVSFGGGPPAAAPPAGGPSTPPGPGPGGGPAPTVFWGGLLLFGFLDAQGGIATSPGQPPTTVSITTTAPGTTAYTVSVVTTGPNGITTSSPLSNPLGPDTKPSPPVPLLIGFRPQPGAGTYNLYQGIPGPAGLVAQVFYNGLTDTTTGTNPDGTQIQGITVTGDSIGPLVTVPITQAPLATQPPPSVPDTTGMIITGGALTTGLMVPPLPQPSTPVLGTSTAGANTLTYAITLINAQGLTTQASGTLTVASVAVPSTLAPITINIDVTNLPGLMQQAFTVVLWRTGAPPGGLAAGPIAMGTPGIAGTLALIDSGQPPLFGMAATPPVGNTTGQAALTTIAGSVNVVPLTNPSAPTVTPLTTGVATASYKLVYLDSLGNTTAASPAGTTTTGAVTPNNAVSWTNLPGTYQVQIYRTVGGATQGLLATVQAGAPGSVQVYTDAAATGNGATAPSTNTTGQLQLNGTVVTVGGVSANLTSKTSVTLASSTTETSLIGTVYGSKSVAANTIVVGTTYRLLAGGASISNTGTPKLTLRFKLGANLFATVDITTAGLSNLVWDTDIMVTCQAAGAAGTCKVIGFARILEGQGGTSVNTYAWSTSGTFDTTATANVDFTGQWDTNSASNTVTCDMVSIEQVR